MILQNIIFPSNKISEVSEISSEISIEDLPMYYRASENFFYNSNKQCYILLEKEIVSFDTYFNAFSLAKWKKYTYLDEHELKLSLTLQGEFYIELKGLSLLRDNIFSTQPFVNKYYSLHDTDTISLDFPQNNCDIVFFKIKAITDVKIFSGAFYADILARKFNNVNISLVICTFKREEYLKRNIKLLHDKIFQKNEIAQNLSVKVIDNGKTLSTQDVELNNKIRLYHNKNCGGTGGFTRGIIETLRDNQDAQDNNEKLELEAKKIEKEKNTKEKFSHVLLMDDDVLINIESMCRTFNLLKILKENFQDSFIGGAMHRLDRKYILYENKGMLTNSEKSVFLPVRPMKFNIDARDIATILFNEREENLPNQYQAWWYCCIPVHLICNKKINKNNKGIDLPMPLFIRGDDIEYSARKCKNIITLNGICVWHDSFELKFSNSIECYFGIRNACILRVIYTKNNIYDILYSLRRAFRMLLFSYNYSGVESLLYAFEDYMKGYKFLLETDPEVILKKQLTKNETWLDLSNFLDIISPLDIPMYDYSDLLNEKRATFIERLLLRVTIGGLLVPGIFFKNAIGFLRSGFTYNPSQTLLRKNILIINTTTDQAILRSFSRRKTISLCLRFWKLIFKYHMCHKWLKKEWQENIHKLTNIDFWNRFLKSNE